MGQQRKGHGDTQTVLDTAMDDGTGNLILAPAQVDNPTLTQEQMDGIIANITSDVSDGDQQ